MGRGELVIGGEAGRLTVEIGKPLIGWELVADAVAVVEADGAAPKARPPSR